MFSSFDLDCWRVLDGALVHTLGVVVVLVLTRQVQVTLQVPLRSDLWETKEKTEKATTDDDKQKKGKATHSVWSGRGCPLSSRNLFRVKKTKYQIPRHKIETKQNFQGGLEGAGPRPMQPWRQRTFEAAVCDHESLPEIRAHVPEARRVRAEGACAAPAADGVHDGPSVGAAGGRPQPRDGDAAVGGQRRLEDGVLHREEARPAVEGHRAVPTRRHGEGRRVYRDAVGKREREIEVQSTMHKKEKLDGKFWKRVEIACSWDHKLFCGEFQF